MRTLKRAGATYELEGRLIHGYGSDVEVTESPRVRVTLWKELNRAQRWISIEIREGELEGRALFIPVEAMTGEGQVVVPGRELEQTLFK